ncbi:hypothetical protein ACHAXN_011919 [Cyclotella atomus]
MHLSTIRSCTLLSIGASIVVTIALNATITRDSVNTKVPPQLSNFQPSINRTDKDTALKLRRNLSESASIGNKTSANYLGPPPPAPITPKTDAQKDQRPSGVVYNYIEPPPINLTARAQLHTQFPNLADLSSSKSSLCAIVKDAEPYLDEWIDYHFGIGFHTIYLIDNSEKHELLQWQNKRRAKGYSVRVLPKPGTHRQMYGYHMCVSEFKEEHTYMAFFDVDEFLVLKKHSNVDDFLVQHLPKGALSISWYIFGSANTTMYSPIPVTKRFMYRDGTSEEDRHQIWYNVKSILMLKDYGGFPQSPHSMKTNKRRAGSNNAWRDTNGAGSYDKLGASNYDRPVDVAVLHHYKYLSPKEFYWKSCVRKTVDDLFKDCHKDGELAPKYVGKIYDDSAWQTLKKNVPRYAMFDEFDDFM